MQRDAIGDEAITCTRQRLHIAQAARSFLAPHLCHTFAEIRRTLPVEPVHVQRVDPLLQPIGLAAQPGDGLFPVTLFVAVTFLHRTPDETENLGIEVEPTQGRLELPLDHFLPDIRLGAGNAATDMPCAST